MAKGAKPNPFASKKAPPFGGKGKGMPPPSAEPGPMPPGGSQGFKKGGAVKKKK
jgi:hypothetical protein